MGGVGLLSVFSLAAAVLVGWGVEDGPYSAPSAPLDLRQVGEVFANRRLRLANFGYLGHMWELYSMWGWMALLLAASADGAGQNVSAAAFLIIASGAVGCIWAGRAADRSEEDSLKGRIARRAQVTKVSMFASGACCLLAAVVFDYFWLLVVVCLVWGVAVVADSAQFSAIISEVADPRYVGTALTMQTVMGFLLTVFSIRIVGAIGTAYGWHWAAASMAVGPALGIVAMHCLENRET